MLVRHRNRECNGFDSSTERPCKVPARVNDPPLVRAHRSDDPLVAGRIVLHAARHGSAAQRTAAGREDRGSQNRQVTVTRTEPMVERTDDAADLAADHKHAR